MTRASRSVLRALGWLGMFATLVWMFYMARKLEAESDVVSV